MKTPDLEVDLGHNPGKLPGSPSSQPHPAQPVKKAGAPLPGPGRLPVPTLGRASLLAAFFPPSPGKAGHPGLAAARLNSLRQGPSAKCAITTSRKKRPAVELISGEGHQKQQWARPRGQAGLASPREQALANRSTGPAPFADPGEGGKARRTKEPLFGWGEKNHIARNFKGGGQQRPAALHPIPRG